MTRTTPRRQFTLDIADDVLRSSFADHLQRTTLAHPNAIQQNPRRTPGTEPPCVLISDSTPHTRTALQIHCDPHSAINRHLLLVSATEQDVIAALDLASSFPELRLLPCYPSPQDTVDEALACLKNRDSGPLADVACALLGAGQQQFILHIGFALLLGHRRRSVTQFAMVMGSAARTLQGATQTKCLPSPHRLLLWGQAFWILWRIRRWGMTSKQAALAGGFQSAASMSAALEPLLGATPRRTVATMSEAGVTGKFVAELAQHLERSAPLQPTRRPDGVLSR